MSDQPIDPRALKLAEEINRIAAESEDLLSGDRLARIIQSHFAESVNGKLLEAAENAWHALNLQANAPDQIVKWRRELRAAISLAKSQPPSMADELAKALDFFVNQGARPGDRIEARELLARYDAQKGQS